MKESLINNEEGKKNDSLLLNEGLNDNLSSIKSNDKSDCSNPINVLYIIILGEIIAILSVGSGEITNKISENTHPHYATVLSFIYYISFGFFWTIFNHGLVKPKFYYFLILFFDTQTNFFKFLALSKGSIYYPYIINSSSILFCALLTFIFIKKYKYTWKHFLACLLCFSGTILSFYGALSGNDNIIDEIKENIIGFICSLISAICFTSTIVVMEIYFTKGKDIYNFFPYLGLFGSFIVAIESFIYYKINEIVIKNFETDLVHILYVLLFVVISLVLATMIPFYIKRYSASMLNFFMISQIFWSFIFSLIFENNSNMSIYFYIGFIVILFSTILFSVFKLKTIPKEINNSNTRMQQINIISPSERTTEL
jgi:drug/metabolite transporter (DMT)-like permease